MVFRQLEDEVITYFHDLKSMKLLIEIDSTCGRRHTIVIDPHQALEFSERIKQEAAAMIKIMREISV